MLTVSVTLYLHRKSVCFTTNTVCELHYLNLEFVTIVLQFYT